MKRFIYVIAIGALFAATACQKEDGHQPQDPTAPVDNFEDLQVSSTFNWSASHKEAVTIQIEDTTGFQLDGQALQLIDEAGQMLDIQRIEQNETRFYLHYPQNGTSLFYYLPATGEKWPVKGTDQTLSLANPFTRTVPANGKLKGNIKGKLQGISLLGNGNFEVNDFTPLSGSIYDPAPQTGRWYHTDNDYEWKKAGGDYRIENRDGRGGFATLLLQTIDVNPGKEYEFSATVKGGLALYIFAFSAHGSFLGYSYNINSGQGSQQISTQYNLPQNAAKVNVLIYFPGNSTDEWADDASLIEVGATQDADGDGVEDVQDAFPTDPQAAYVSHYPTSGRQTVAFEDLWPSQGDYDFNDLVASSRFEIIKDAQQNITKIKGKVAIEALGAGSANGLGIDFKILNSTGIRRLTRRIIGNATGDAQLDSRNSSGIILYQRPSDVLQEVYWNTRGSYTTPDTLNFTVEISASHGVNSIIPQFFIFHSNDRGHEIHLPGQSPTAAFDQNLSNSADDAGNYRTTNGLPWGIELVTPARQPFRFPRERVDILNAYTQFQVWATSQGSQKTDWYNAPVSSKVVNRGN